MIRVSKTATYRQEVQAYSRRLEMLHDTALLINQADQEGQIYPLLLEKLRSVIRFDSASVLLVDNNHLRVVAFVGFPQDYVEIGLRIPINDRTPSSTVVHGGQPIRIRDMHRAYPEFAEDSPATANKIISWLGVPLTWKNKTIGQIALDRWRLEPFAEDDMRLATIIANHAAGAIERIRLHAQVIENSEQLELRVAQRTAEIEQAQAAISNLAERLALATRTAGIGVWDWELANNRLFLDENTKHLLKIPLDVDADYIYRHWHNYIHPDDRTGLLAEFATVLRNEQSSALRFRIFLPDGSVRYIYSTATTFRSPDNKVQRVIGVASDVTEEWEAEAQRSKTQENLRQSEEHLRRTNAELERADRLKDEFLANMSHELRTPLNAILVLSESLQEAVYGAVNDRQQQALNDVVASGQHLLTLINDVLDMSKLEAGKMELQYADVTIADVCQASLRLVRELALQKHQELSLRLPANELVLCADERRLKQMLVNLLSNAVKFTPEGGRIALEVGPGASVSEVSFTVHDTGIGIAHDRLQHLFQPFSQLDSTLSRKYGGTGLGLAIVRRLADLHGGRVEVQSDVQIGTRFIITLPVEPSGAWQITTDAESEA